MVNTNYSGIIPVTDPAEVRTLQSPPLVMPDEGYFYTFVTNSSQTMVEFNNLVVRHKQGVILAQYDYYAYGLMWSDPNPDDIYNKTAQSQEWNQNEFGDTGLDLYRFEARMYDPVVGRWTSPDPAQQFFNNYIGMANNPANFVDPDGRTAFMDVTSCGPPGTNLPSVFGIIQTVFAVKNLVDNIKAVKSMAISNGAQIMNSHAASLINQVATGMMARGVADGVSGASDPQPPTVYIFHHTEGINNPEFDPIKNDQQMEEIRKEMQSIFDLNKLGVEVVIITEEKAKEVVKTYRAQDALVMVSTDPFLSGTAGTNGNTGINDVNGGASRLHKSSYVGSRVAKDDQIEMTKNGLDYSLEKLIAYYMAHEVIHQYLTKAAVWRLGLGKILLPGQSTSGEQMGAALR
jgi:RHS repeat-associated protein